MFLAGKPGQKKTFLAKRVKKKCSWLENQDKNKHCWQKKGKKLFLAGKKPEHNECWLAKTAVK